MSSRDALRIISQVTHDEFSKFQAEFVYLFLKEKSTPGHGSKDSDIEGRFLVMVKACITMVYHTRFPDLGFLRIALFTLCLVPHGDNLEVFSAHFCTESVPRGSTEDIVRYCLNRKWELYYDRNLGHSTRFISMTLNCLRCVKIQVNASVLIQTVNLGTTVTGKQKMYTHGVGNPNPGHRKSTKHHATFARSKASWSVKSWTVVPVHLSCIRFRSPKPHGRSCTRCFQTQRFFRSGNHPESMM